MVLKEKLSSSSLLEVVVAMLLVTIIMSLSMGIFTNIMKNSFNARKVEAFVRIKTLAFIAQKEKRFLTEEFTETDYKIKKKADYYAGATGVIQLLWYAEDEEGRILAEYRQIIAEDAPEE